MNKKSVGEVLGIVANLGVLIGLFFLAFEIRMSNRIALVANEMEIRARWNSVNELIKSDPAVAELLVKARNLDAKWSAVEEEQIYSMILASMNIWTSIFTGYELGLVEAETLEGAELDIQLTVTNYPGFLPLIRIISQSYPRGANQSFFTVLEQELDKSE